MITTELSAPRHSGHDISISVKCQAVDAKHNYPTLTSIRARSQFPELTGLDKINISEFFVQFNLENQQLQKRVPLSFFTW